MDDDGPTASIIFYVAMLLIDMFFYGFGAALDSLNEKEIERRAEEDIEGHSRDRKSIRLRAIIGNPAEYLNTVQLITTLINIVIGTVHLRLLLGVLSQGLQLVAENQFQLKRSGTDTHTLSIGSAAHNNRTRTHLTCLRPRQAVIILVSACVSDSRRSL